MILGRGWRQGIMRSDCSVGTDDQFCKLKNVVEMDGGDGCLTM